MLDRGRQCLHLSDALGGEGAEFVSVAANRVDQSNPLADQRLAYLQDHALSLLVDGFRRDEMHPQTRGGLADRFGVVAVIFAALDVWFDVLRREQAHRVTGSSELSSPKVRAGAGPQGNDRGRQTSEEWHHPPAAAAWLLDPVVAKIRQHVFAAEKIHVDDTTVPVLAPGLGRTATGRLRVYVRNDRLFDGPAAPAAAYFYSPDRGAEHPTAHMANFTGLLQADGYAGFEGLYNPARTKPGPITEVACWAHCRRKFFDVWEATKSPVAKEALDRIAKVYAIEDKARFAPAAE